MRYVVGLWRLATAFVCLASVSVAWHAVNYWVFFTFQTGLLLGFVMLWAGAASLLDGRQPPAWLKGCVTLFIIVTGLVAWLILPPDDPATAKYVFGIMTNILLHRVAPIMAVIDFLLFDKHRRIGWTYPLTWLLYFPVYLAFVLIRGWLWPHSGPRAGDDPYPYGFIDPTQISWEQLAINCVGMLAGFAILGLVIFLIDRILPAKPLVGR
ncbi:Pr6Pr family membrane protein [Bifidobacterium mongoliense]|uniref:Pr6Pr family membrane protein n=1 Tax=Bifidobacterium mongoliense TaxID=518643 RepID=UPI002A75D4D3|nr:Pr6Pr family membrane protein [Bifidobacterium mongoliense]MDY3125652.1 Pr6Pr family membrane protein [Bifidobacterium mongoliense]